jgi:hypothetical protein
VTDGTEVESKHSSTLTAGLIVVALYTLASLFCWQHLLEAGVTTHMYRLNLGDVGQGVWFMGWLPFAIGHHTNPFVSTYMLAPHGFNLLTNTNFFLEALILAPITELSSPLTSFNVACIAAPVISAGSLYFVLRRYEMRRAVAFVGGLVYGFSPAVLQADRIGHFNLTWMFFPPLALYLIDRICFRQTGSPLRLGLVLGLLAVAQFFSSPEILLDCVVVGVPAVAVAAAANWRQIASHARFALAASATAILTAGALLAYPIAFYVTGPDHVSYVNAAVAPGATLSSLVWPSGMTGHGFLVAPPGTPLLHRFDLAFVGPVIVLLALGALAFARRHRAILLLWGAALWCIVCSWGAATRPTGTSHAFGWHAPAWYLVSAFPLLRNVGWLRISILTNLLLALLASITLEGVLTAWRAAHGQASGRVEGLIAGAAGVLMAVPMFIGGRVPFAGYVDVSVPAVLRSIPALSDGRPSIALILPGSGPFAGTPMAWQAIAGFPYADYDGYAWHPQAGSKTGVVGPLPTVLVYITAKAAETSPTVVLSAAQRRQIGGAFAKYHVTEAVVIDGYPGSKQLTRVYNQLFGSGRRIGNGEIWNAARIVESGEVRSPVK